MQSRLYGVRFSGLMVCSACDNALFTISRNTGRPPIVTSNTSTPTLVVLRLLQIRDTDVKDHTSFSHVIISNLLPNMTSNSGQYLHEQTCLSSFYNWNTNFHMISSVKDNLPIRVQHYSHTVIQLLYNFEGGGRCIHVTSYQFDNYSSHVVRHFSINLPLKLHWGPFRCNNIANTIIGWF